MGAQAKLIRFAVGAAMAVATASPAMSRAGGIHTEDPWAAVHIEGLPAAIRQVVARETEGCGGKIAALHAFTRYIEGAEARLVAVHYDETNCARRRAICTEQSCLHQIFVSSGTGYRL